MQLQAMHIISSLYIERSKGGGNNNCDRQKIPASLFPCMLAMWHNSPGQWRYKVNKLNHAQSNFVATEHMLIHRIFLFY